MSREENLCKEVLGALAGPAPLLMEADLVLRGGRVLTLVPEQPEVEAVAIRGNRVLAVGTESELKAYLGPQTEVIDAQGLTVVPGLTDTHLHLLHYGFALNQVDLGGVRSVGELRRRVADFVAQRKIKPGRWVLGRGWDQNLLAEGRLPRKEDLDGIAPENPMLLSRICGHAALLNRRGLEAAGLTAATPDPEGGRLQRGEGGELTGIVFELGAIGLVQRAIPAAGPADLEEALALATARAAQAGLTEAHSDDLGSAGGFARAAAAYTALAKGGRLPLRIRMALLVGSLGELKDVLAAAQDWQSPSELISLGPIKIVSDGSLGARTAALEEPYSDAPGERGLMNFAAEELKEMVTLAHQAGFQVAVHVIGDRAARLALEAVEAAQARYPRPDARHRLVHCQIMNPALWEKMRALGVAGDVQPRFVASDWPMVESRVGKERARTSYAWKSMLARGLHLAGGSDCPVEPLDPLLGLHAAIARTDPAGNPAGGWQPAEKLAPLTALGLFTEGAAYVARAEGERGRLAPGYLADLTAFAGDYLAAPEETALANDVRLTISAGRVVYRRS